MYPRIDSMPNLKIAPLLPPSSHWLPESALAILTWCWTLFGIMPWMVWSKNRIGWWGSTFLRIPKNGGEKPLPGQFFLRHSLQHDLSSSDLDEDQIRDEENVADDNNTSDGCLTKLFDFCDTHPMATVNVNCVALNTIWASFAWICQAGWKVWKSAEKCNYFLLSYLCAQIAHSTVHYAAAHFPFLVATPHFCSS